MLHDDDRAQMRDDSAEIVADRPIAITLHRGDQVLDAQTVRLTRDGNIATAKADGAETRSGAFLVIGPIDLDIAIDDWFVHEGNFYWVSFVRVTRTTRTVAECTLQTKGAP